MEIFTEDKGDLDRVEKEQVKEGQVKGELATSSWWPSQGATAKDVHMEMRYRVCRILAHIEDQAIAVAPAIRAEALSLGDGASRGKDVTQYFSVFGPQMVCVGNVRSRDDEHMSGCARADVTERIRRRCRCDLLGGHLPSEDLAEQAVVGHRPKATLLG